MFDQARKSAIGNIIVIVRRRAGPAREGARLVPVAIGLRMPGLSVHIPHVQRFLSSINDRAFSTVSRPLPVIELRESGSSVLR
jgi:hypothetical protein